MKLAYSAWAMPALPIESQLAIVRAPGYVGIELVSMPGASTFAPSLDAAERRRIRRAVRESGLVVTAIAGHGDMLAANADARAANTARVRAAIDLAADLADPADGEPSPWGGPPLVVTMGFGRPDQYETQRHQLAEIFGELARYAGARGVTVALEPHVGQAIDLPERCVWLLDTVGSPHFRLNFDNSHFEVMGRDLDDYLPVLLPYSAHTHLKDQRGRSPNHQFLAPGDGDFDYARYLRAMAQAGYQGYVTIEISVMVQRQPGYDPAATAARSFQTAGRRGNGRRDRSGAPPMTITAATAFASPSVRAAGRPKSWPSTPSR